MKLNRLGLITIVGLLFMCVFASAEDERSSAETETALLKIEGMTCGGCGAQVKSALKSIQGVKECQVDWKAGTAKVQFEGDESKAQEMVKAVNKLAFSASLTSVSLAAKSAKPETSQPEKSAQKEKPVIVPEKNIFAATTYECSHCNYSQIEAGKCPVCGDKLTKTEKPLTFACSHCNYSSAKAGQCPSCKAELVQYQITYQCPACQKSFSEAGKCPVCRTALQSATADPVQLQTKAKKPAPDKIM